MYDDSVPLRDARPVPIIDWAKTVANYGIMVEQMLTFSQVSRVVAGLVSDEAGLFAYSGTMGAHYGQRYLTAQGDKSRLKTCTNQDLYAASCAPDIHLLPGYDPHTSPGDIFSLGWFPGDDPIASVVAQRYEEWPEDECSLFLPKGLSPSESSIELVGLGWDMDVIGLFMGDSSAAALSLERLRELLGEDAVLAAVDVEDFWHWLEWKFSDEDMMPVDRELPFKI